MLLHSREVSILRIFQERGEAKIAGLNELFKVSPNTIRRSLAKIENEGYIKRVHGGAVSTNLKPGTDRQAVSLLWRYLSF